MNSDKISNGLEKQLKTLGQQVRINILKRINQFEKPLSFSMLQKEVLGTNPNSINFSFHLKALKRVNLLSSSSEGYVITNLGKNMLKNIISMERLLNAQNKTIMIRTSKYSKEPFDAEKIEKHLVKEGGMEINLAKKISQEVDDRLSKTKVNYLTTPLMREYVNGILIEKGFEKIRHKLTRLGVPPFEIFNLFNSNSARFSPDSFIRKLGSEASEQFLLLSLLPNHLADMYLSQEIFLIDLNYWALRPHGLYINTEALLETISKRYSINTIELKNSKDTINLLYSFIDILNELKPFFSKDILLGEFNQKFLLLFNSLKNEKVPFYMNLLSSQILKFNGNASTKPSLSLDFCYSGTSQDQNANQFRVDKLFLNILSECKNLNVDLTLPMILFDYSQFKASDINGGMLNDMNSCFSHQKTIFYDYNANNLMNSTLIKAKNSKNNAPPDNKIILDKVFINLYSIAKKASQNDDIFCDLLHEKVKNVFEFFGYKTKFVEQKLKSLEEWNMISTLAFNEKKADCIKEALKSVSFFGLNEAIKHHCGIELDRIEKSESFAFSILKQMRNLITEKNNQENEFFVFSQPHRADNMINSCELIRSSSNQSLDQKICLFKKFEQIIDGGIVFNNSFDLKEISHANYFKKLLNSNLQAFSMKKDLF